MRRVPLAYPLRSLLHRWSPSLLSALGIGLTAAVFAAILSLREGLRTLFATTGSEDVIVYLRPGAQSEGESVVRHPQETSLLRLRPEVAADASGAPLAAAESCLGVKLDRADGSGRSLVPVRGIEPASIPIQGRRFRIVEGRPPAFGADEVVVGRPLTARIRGCRVGGTLVLNVTPFRVVGVFEHDGAYASEVWGDVERITSATQRPTRQRVVARLRPGTDVGAVALALESDRRSPAQARTERAYFEAQASRLGGALLWLAAVLASMMGAAAVLGAVNTMLAGVSARTGEIGILSAMGYGSGAVFVSFLVEAAVIGAAGGAIGTAIVLPLQGLATATTNWSTFTEVSFAFRVSAGVLARAVAAAVLLGLVGGVVPAWRASRLRPAAALRRA